jgi:hypothetical protein
MAINVDTILLIWHYNIRKQNKDSNIGQVNVKYNCNQTTT